MWQLDHTGVNSPPSIGDEPCLLAGSGPPTWLQGSSWRAWHRILNYRLARSMPYVDCGRATSGAPHTLRPLALATHWARRLPMTRFPTLGWHGCRIHDRPLDGRYRKLLRYSAIVVNIGAGPDQLVDQWMITIASPGQLSPAHDGRRAELVRGIQRAQQRDLGRSATQSKGSAARRGLRPFRLKRDRRTSINRQSGWCARRACRSPSDRPRGSGRPPSGQGRRDRRPRRAAD